VDATLVFGTPIVAFSLQAALLRQIEYVTAFSALALGALYLALGWWLVRRQAGDRPGQPLAGECFAALGARLRHAGGAAGARRPLDLRPCGWWKVRA
jgi:hypothetical protein